MDGKTQTTCDKIFLPLSMFYNFFPFFFFPFFRWTNAFQFYSPSSCCVAENEATRWIRGDRVTAISSTVFFRPNTSTTGQFFEVDFQIYGNLRSAGVRHSITRSSGSFCDEVERSVILAINENGNSKNLKRNNWKNQKFFNLILFFRQKPDVLKVIHTSAQLSAIPLTQRRLFAINLLADSSASAAQIAEQQRAFTSIDVFFRFIFN